MSMSRPYFTTRNFIFTTVSIMIVFVVDSDGNVSNVDSDGKSHGVKIVFGGVIDTTPPSAPTGLTIQ